MKEKDSNRLLIVFILIALIGIIFYTHSLSNQTTGLDIQNYAGNQTIYIQASIPESYKIVSDNSLYLIVDVYVLPVQANPVDFPLTIYITNANQSEIYYSETQTFALSGHVSLAQEIPIPTDMPNGNYLAIASSNYIGSNVSSSDSFQKIDATNSNSAIFNKFFGSILALILYLFLGFLIIRDVLINRGSSK